MLRSDTTLPLIHLRSTLFVCLNEKPSFAIFFFSGPPNGRRNVNGGIKEYKRLFFAVVAFEKDVSVSKHSNGLQAHTALSVCVARGPAKGNNKTTTNLLRLLKTYFLRTCERSLTDSLCKPGL